MVQRGLRHHDITEVNVCTQTPGRSRKNHCTRTELACDNRGCKRRVSHADPRRGNDHRVALQDSAPEICRAAKTGGEDRDFNARVGFQSLKERLRFFSHCAGDNDWSSHDFTTPSASSAAMAVPVPLSQPSRPAKNLATANWAASREWFAPHPHWISFAAGTDVAASKSWKAA